jgi:hypothetical protein
VPFFFQGGLAFDQCLLRSARLFRQCDILVARRCETNLSDPRTAWRQAMVAIAAVRTSWRRASREPLPGRGSRFYSQNSAVFGQSSADWYRSRWLSGISDR